MALITLTTDVLLNILLCVPIVNIPNARLVCKRLKIIIDAGHFWRLHAQRVLNRDVDDKIFNYFDYIKYLGYNYHFIIGSELFFSPMEIVLWCIKNSKNNVAYFIKHLTNKVISFAYGNLSDQLLASGYLREGVALANIDAGDKLRYLYANNLFDSVTIDQERSDDMNGEKDMVRIIQQQEPIDDCYMTYCLNDMNFHMRIIDILDCIVKHKNIKYLTDIENRAKTQNNYAKWHSYIKLLTLDFDYLKQNQELIKLIPQFALVFALEKTTSLELFLFLITIITFKLEEISNLLIYTHSSTKLFNYVINNCNFTITKKRILTSKCIYDFNGAVRLLNYYNNFKLKDLECIPSDCYEFKKYVQGLLTQG